jgi:hypothetical protein
MVFVVILSPRRRRSARRICFSQKRPERSGIIATSAMMSGRLYGFFQQRQRPFSRSFELAWLPLHIPYHEADLVCAIHPGTFSLAPHAV